jgi:cyclic beta-1,2-glucan synthetase
MRRFRGHFFNWYDLRRPAVLEPAYVSTVDSGNLAGHLLALRQACLGRRCGAGSPANRRGPRLGAPDVGPASISASARRSPRRWGEAWPTVGARRSRPRSSPTRESANGRWSSASCSTRRPRLRERDGRREAVLHRLPAHTRTRSTPSYYDLLASEARLASFVAIAKNDVPVEHWFRLGRTLTHASGRDGAGLVEREHVRVPDAGAGDALVPLHPAGPDVRGAVRRQIAYGAERGVPWGVSESAYNLRDRHLTYQYRAFGVPDLALKRGLGRDLVIAPYASALALMVDPQRALDNLAALEEKGALGPVRLPRRARLHPPGSGGASPWWATTWRTTSA